MAIARGIASVLNNNKTNFFSQMTEIYIIVRQRVRGSTRFRNPRPVAMLSERSEDTIPAGRGFLNRVDPIGRAV